MISLQEIEKAKHIVIITNNQTFCIASALYTHILRLHKKVSLYCENSIDNKYSFLPWFDKMKNIKSSSADLSIKLESTSLIDFLTFEDIKYNQKMAQALYAGLLEIFYDITNKNLDGMLFAKLDEMRQLGADHRMCTDNLLQSESLSLYRLKGKMFQEMLLVYEAKASLFILSEQVLKETGTSMVDAYKVLQESLKITHVKYAILLDERYELIKIIEDK